MDDSYFEPTPAYLGRGVKLLVLLSILRIQNPLSWTAFLSLNPGIRTWLQRLVRARHKDPETVDRRLRKLANLLSVVFLYSATRNNVRIPKDYVSLYICEAYYSKLVPPSSPIVVSPTTARWFKLGSYRENGWVRQIYRNKHFLLFPLICGQILSNYLTPTRYKLNQRYFSGFIKTRFLDPIWINFRMGVGAQSLDWLGLLASYAKHNGLLFLYMAACSFKERFLAPYAEIGHSGYHAKLKRLLTDFSAYAAHRANAVANFVYVPNLLAMVFLSLTAPMLTKIGFLKRAYMKNQKSTVKMYMRGVGFAAALSGMLLQTIDFVPVVGLDEKRNQEKPPKATARTLDGSFYNAVNTYLAQLIVLSKWRILKENHPWFTLLKVGTWQRMETAVMCYLVWKLMNLNDYIFKNSFAPGGTELQDLRANRWLRVVDRIMN